MNVFVLNCGSSSLKFQIIKTGEDLMKHNKDITICKGLVERIGGPAIVSIKVNDKTALETEPVLHDHTEAIKYIIDWIVSGEVAIPGIKSLADINAVGHRTVHGAEDFNTSVIITDEVIACMESNIELAPLHNPANIMGIRAAIKVFGHDMPQVAVFDTGFHGTSHRYVAERWREITGHSVEETNVITLHLGNGASMDCIKNGKSYDTSMGFTPLEGLVMGTRCGDIDPSIIEFLMKKENLSIEGAIKILNKDSGVKGVSGLTNDFRDLEGARNENPRAMLALNMFSQRIKKYIGAYMAQLNGTKAIIFTGGIGENSITMRQMIIENLENMGIIFDPEKNKNFKRGVDCKLNADNSPVEIYIIPTNEELVIARDTFCIIAGIPCM